MTCNILLQMYEINLLKFLAIILKNGYNTNRKYLLNILNMIIQNHIQCGIDIVSTM